MVCATVDITFNRADFFLAVSSKLPNVARVFTHTSIVLMETIFRNLLYRALLLLIMSIPLMLSFSLRSSLTFFPLILSLWSSFLIKIVERATHAVVLLFWILSRVFTIVSVRSLGVDIWKSDSIASTLNAVGEVAPSGLL